MHLRGLQQPRKRPAEAGHAGASPETQAITPLAVSAYSSIWSKFMYL
jgi:hypothetical protein